MQQQLSNSRSDWIYLTEDLQFLFLLFIGGQSSKLLQQHGTWRGGDVQEVEEGLADGAGRDTSLVCPVADYTWGEEHLKTQKKVKLNKNYVTQKQMQSKKPPENYFLIVFRSLTEKCPGTDLSLKVQLKVLLVFNIVKSSRIWTFPGCIPPILAK